MKKLIAAFLAAALLFCVSCKKAEVPQKTEEKPEEKINGVWISYIETDAMIKEGNFAEKFAEAVKSCKAFKITDIFFHAVPFCDAYYKSEIYPLRNADVLADAVKIAHQNGIRLHAWINPYRVKTSDNDVTSLPEASVAKRLLRAAEDNSFPVLSAQSGVYLNPADMSVRKTVIEAVRELCRNYGVDGIHFDDYFYPTAEPSFDEASYNAYKTDNENPLTLAEYRTCAVNSLISGCYTAVKFIDKDIIFSVSPAADIEKNRFSYYADIKAWCESGCVDVIIPQAYFGFCYPQKKFCFQNLVNEWKQLVAGSGTRLCMGLAAYKTGTENAPDCEEWQSADDILSRETEICRNDAEISGEVYYSYSSLFGGAELNCRSREKVFTVLDSTP